MSNKTAATITEPPDGLYNPETLLPLMLSCLFGGILILYFILGCGWLSWQWQQERQTWRVKKEKKERKQEQRDGSDATSDIPLKELKVSGRTRGNGANGEVRDAFLDTMEICTSDVGKSGLQRHNPTVQRPSNGLSSSVFGGESPSNRQHDRMNVRRSIINPRTHATPESNLARIRPDLHNTQSRVRTMSSTLSHADSSTSTSRTYTKTEACSAPAESSCPARAHSDSEPRTGLGLRERPPPSPTSRAKSMNRPSFSEHQPYPQPAFSTSGKFARTMGTKTLDAEKWLTLDHQYPRYHKVRAQLLATHPNETIQVLTGSEDACIELLHKVTDHLCEKYPEQFQLQERVHGSGEWAIHNLTTGEYFYTSPVDTRFAPLEICARLTQDDFNILMQDSAGGEHKLVASATLFPAAWKLRQRIGYTITQLHGPVPLWSTKLAPSVEKYFSRLHSPLDGEPNTYGFKERSGYFIQTLSPATDLLSHSSLFIQTSDAMCNFPISGRLDKDWIVVRRERQTFTRLERTGAIVFTG
ncbi:hypothetical protein FKW77_000206 [Venturia effusa]|uniref:Uncharacterized protein n=1 Tax=Venturia effusa TaxID=50376 RepID=A0A517LPC0_9PEZI|nr:hypothetical protein FKW77_000206 [Venturia effusa]